MQIYSNQSLFSEAKPLDVEEFATMMLPYSLHNNNSSMAVAVSGGPDSMALAVCLQRWSQALSHKKSLLALVVDHRLREHSAREALNTKQYLNQFQIDAEILTWQHDPVASHIHRSARDARYKLLIDACLSRGHTTLLMAHHRDDQAETILMRLAKGSGIDGLSGIPDDRMTLEGVRIVRPLIHVPKERLVATCLAQNIPFVEDPSNASQNYARGRLRRVMPLLAKEGLTVENILNLGRRAKEAKEALDFVTHHHLRNYATLNEYGVVYLDRPSLLLCPRAIMQRVMIASLQTLNPHRYAPEYDSLDQIINELTSDEEMSPRTLHGCLISQNKAKIIIMRELAPITNCPRISKDQEVLFDGRWRVRLHVPLETPWLEVRPLGHQPHAIIDNLQPQLRSKLPQGRARASLPSLWYEDKLVLIPTFGLSDGPSSADATHEPKTLAQ